MAKMTAGILSVTGTILLTFLLFACGSYSLDKDELRLKAKEMFLHGYKSYMNYAYPADELMPLSCKGRYRDSEPSRGDIDDSLGNFSLTLIDTLDSLLVLGEIEEFERSVLLVTSQVTFDSDVVVSVFETNIRVLGGLLSGHLMAEHAKRKLGTMNWYNGELLQMATDLGNRLLPAFNTSTGIPYPRVNLRYGVHHAMSRTGTERDTCTACAGSMILEFAALSRLTGNSIYEEKASKAMDYLWKSRHRASDLVGTVINIHSGEWVRRDSGIGAGIDSYYEYLFKSYIMLGDENFLDRFNLHYRAVMKYINNGLLMVDVHMHKPYTQARNFMDALLAFWPGLQVLKGDLKSAIELHEMLYQVIQRHNFLPEAFTTEFRVHWPNHPLRPEFIESTYLLYKATADPHYLEVGKFVLDSLERHARVACGFAAIKDVTTGRHEDQMDSYVLAETFKYLYLLFAEKDDLVLDIDNYVLTTEAHLLPLFISSNSSFTGIFSQNEDGMIEDDDEENDRSCVSVSQPHLNPAQFATSLRMPLRNFVEKLYPKPNPGGKVTRLKASQFVAGNLDHIAELSRMGVKLVTMNDGRVQLIHIASEADSSEASGDGLQFMKDMIEISKLQTENVQQEPRYVQLMSHPYNGLTSVKAGPAQFGVDLKGHPGVEGQAVMARPFRGCSSLENLNEVSGKFVIVERGDCMFIDKAKHIQEAGGLGGIVFDSNSQSSSDNQPLFAMSGDGKTQVSIPMVFLFHHESEKLKHALQNHPNIKLYVGENLKSPDDKFMQNLLNEDEHKSTMQNLRIPETSDKESKREDVTEGDSRTSIVESDQDENSAVEDEKKPKNKNLYHTYQITEMLEVLLAQINMNSLIPMLRSRYIEVDKNHDILPEKNRDGHIESTKQKLSEGDDVDESHLDVRTLGDDHTITSSSNNQQDTNSDSFKKSSYIYKNSDKSAHSRTSSESAVRSLFIEFLSLLRECTSLTKLENLAQIVHALTRLVERVLTGGRLSYDTQTEQLIEKLSTTLEISPHCIQEHVTSVSNNDIDSGRDENSRTTSTDPATSQHSPLNSDTSNDQNFDAVLYAFIENQLNQLLLNIQKAYNSGSSRVQVESTSTEEQGARENLKSASSGISALMEEALRTLLNLPEEILTTPSQIKAPMGDVVIQSDDNIYIKIDIEGKRTEIDSSREKVKLEDKTTSSDVSQEDSDQSVASSADNKHLNSEAEP